MEKFIVTGEVQLSGRIAVSGAKNATLPIMAAALLCEGKSVLYRVPDLRDIAMMQKIMELLGAKIVRDGDKMLIDTYSVSKAEIPELLMREMRASVFLMGPLLARFRRVRLSYPGGCAIGPRPINLHLKALEHLGAIIEETCGFIDAKADQLKGNEITFDFPSVGATENAMMAAVLAKGTTILHNAAREPEIADLEQFLNSMGAKVKGAGTDSIVIEGVTKLHGAEHRIMPDRIEAGTLLLAGAVTKGDVEVTNIHHSYLFSVIDKLRELGARITYYADSIRLQAGVLSGIDVKTLPYPGFPTDLQAPMLSVLTVAKGTSVVSETIFENRFKHVDELIRMGAKIQVEGRTAIIRGVPQLCGASVAAPDLRAGSALVLAALAAVGTTEIDQVYHIDRGYERLEEKLQHLGAAIVRKESD